jgi:hypothetical protein
VAQSHTPCNRCVRFATTVASDRATLATKRTLLLTWAGLAPAGSHQLALAHSFDHLVGAGEQRRRNFQAERFGGLEIDGELEFDRRLNRELGRLGSFEDAIDVYGRAPKQIDKVDAIGKSTPLRSRRSGTDKSPALDTEPSAQ